MRFSMRILVLGLICLSLGPESVSAGVNSGAGVSLSQTVVQGDTIDCAVYLSSTTKTRVVDLMFELPESLDLLSWEDGSFFSNPLRIGPTFHEPTRRVLVALAVKGRQPVVASSGEVGRLRFLRTGADSVGPNLVEAILVDDQHRRDALVSPGIPVKSAGSYRPAAPLPVRFALHTARPNPVRVGTVVTFDIPSPGAEVKIKIYDVGGRVVRTILDTYRPPGYYSESWDLKNTHGRRVAPGIYFCSMQAGEFKDVKKMVLLK